MIKNEIIKSNYPSAKLRLDFLKECLAKNADALVKAFASFNPDYRLIRETFYLFSWRINELSWEYKYTLKKKNLVSEEAWHLFDFICQYLNSHSDVNLSQWDGVAKECQQLSNIVNDIASNDFSYSSLASEIRPAFAQSHMNLIVQQLKNFFAVDKEFDPENKIDCHALLGLLMTLGESCKRLTGIQPHLPDALAMAFEKMKSIRDLLEKKLPGNLFNSPELLREVYNQLKQLFFGIKQYQEQQTVTYSNSGEDNALKQLLALLEEKSTYRYSEQAKIFFASLEGCQSHLLQLLKTGYFESYLNERFGIKYDEFKAAIDESKKNLTQNFSQEQKDLLVQLANENLEENSLLKPLLKLIRSPKTKPNSIERFLSAKQINIPEMNDILNSKSMASDILIIEIINKTGITKENLLQLDKLQETLNKHHADDDFELILFSKIKEMPWLLELTDQQNQLLQVLNSEDSLEDKESVDCFLSAHNLDGAKIHSVLYPDKLLYQPRAYHTKFSSSKNSKNDILRIANMIEKLINLLIEVKQKNISQTFMELIAKNFHYQLALQIGIKAFGIIVKQKLGQEAKQQLLSGNSSGITEKHIKLLELFRNELAHRATEVNPDELTWFALQWAIISYPAIKSKIANQFLQPIQSMTKAQPEYAITEEMIHDFSMIMQDMASQYGCKVIRVFSSSLNCHLGIQAELNIIIEPALGELTALDLYNLQWKIHSVLDFNVHVYTNQTLKSKLSLTTSANDIAAIEEQAIDLVTIRHLSKMKAMLQSDKWHELFFTAEQQPMRRSDINIDDIDLKKIRTIVSASQTDDFLLRRQYREKMLENSQVREIISHKAQTYTDSLLQFVKVIPDKAKLIFSERLRSVMTLHTELDNFYEENMNTIIGHDLEISRFIFRSFMRSKHDKLPEEIRETDLAAKAKQDWEQEAFIIEDLAFEHGELVVQQLNTLYFLIDEVKNPEVIPFLFYNANAESGNDSYTQLLKLIEDDFCQRFLDPYEEDMTVHFTKPVRINLMQNQIINGIGINYRVVSGVHEISFDSPVNFSSLARQPKQFTYLRMPLYVEVLNAASDSLEMPIIDFGIETKLRHKVLSIQHQYQLLPEDMEMTIEKLFTVINYNYGGKLQKLSCQAATFEYPPITNFKKLLEKDNVDVDDYPDYEVDKKEFDQFQEVKTCLYNIFYYEKYIENIEVHKCELENSWQNLPDNSGSANINEMYISELAQKVSYLKSLQEAHIQKLFKLDYVMSSADYGEHKFKAKLAHEVADWVYHGDDENSAKDKLFNLILNCFNRANNRQSLFFESEQDVPLATIKRQSHDVKSNHRFLTNDN